MNIEIVFWSYAAQITLQVSSPQAHLHLLGIHFHLCKPHPASVWLIPLWSISGRRHRYCWSPHCTAKQFQILSVGIEKSIDILPTRAIMYTMNILILFSQCVICAPHSIGLVFWVNWFCLMLWRCEPLCNEKKKRIARMHFLNFIISLYKKKGYMKVEETFEGRNDSDKIHFFKNSTDITLWRSLSMWRFHKYL